MTNKEDKIYSIWETDGTSISAAPKMIATVLAKSEDEALTKASHLYSDSWNSYSAHEMEIVK